MPTGKRARSKPRPDDDEEDRSEITPAQEIKWPKEVETLDEGDLRKKPLHEWLRHFFPEAAARDVMFGNMLSVIENEVRVHAVHSLEDLRRKTSYATQAEVWLRSLRRVGYRV